MSGRWPEGIRRRKEGEALRVYARLLVEHERVRRLRGGAAPSAAAACKPSPRVWRPLHDVAFFQAAGERSAPLRDFCSRFPRGDEKVAQASCLCAWRRADTGWKPVPPERYTFHGDSVLRASIKLTQSDL